MKKNSLTKKIILFDELPSTNSKAKELARNGGEEGTVIIAKVQKKGRGRFEREWESPEGGLYLSVILRPEMSPDKATLLPLVASLAVFDAIKSYGLSAKIKWPNDIRVNRKKIAGILLESEAVRNRLEYAVLGVGINLNTDINSFSRELKDDVTSLAQELDIVVDYQQFLEKLLSAIETRYSTFSNGDFNTILGEWKRHSDTIGRKVKIITSTDEIIGKAYDVDQSGFLIIATDSDEHKIITSGDCIYFDE